MNTWHLHIEGQVQGVGFRPFVYNLAHFYDLKGWVNNTFDGVHIVFNADLKLAIEFKTKLLDHAPNLSKITSAHLDKVDKEEFTDFKIIHSESKGTPRLLISPDFALCGDCRAELYEIKNRRYHYPFITCTNCGPRFSIIDQLPYDRVNTRMDDFKMCRSCQDEYNDPTNRRYYSQTNSCKSCGIQLQLFDRENKLISKQSEVAIQKVVEAWSAGKIVAIKGIGGYLITCDATNNDTLKRLRVRKHRPSKPFALMVPNLEFVRNWGVGEAVTNALVSPTAPIVLVNDKGHIKSKDVIAPGLDHVGIMLPYTPLYDLLLQQFGKPIIATSGNISNAPIIYQGEKALEELFEIADLILSNNRAIVIPQDDSVFKFSAISKQKIVLRRSRGLAPTYINPDLKMDGQSVMAMGAMLKSTFSLSARDNIYISQYLGDLESFDAQQSYEHTITHFLQLLKAEPEVLLTDLHPTYPSTQIGSRYAQKWSIPVESIQHHEAHFGAILGEHNLIESKVPILGVIWDGTGLGSDNQIWGGEFFLFENSQLNRIQHFEYFDFILGDKMPKEPRISALSACWGLPDAEEWLKPKFTATEWQIYSKLLGKKNPLQTSSVGRIFDAVAALLGLMDKQTYEGEAAMRLEAIAAEYFQENGLASTSCYLESEDLINPIPIKQLLSKLIQDLAEGKSKAFIAAKFHYSLAMLVKQIATELKVKQIAFSGGVFQNSVLVDLIQVHLKNDFDLFFHQELSPNDENISFGQLVCFQIRKNKAAILNHKSNNHVFSDSR